jgi:hypothetical protein
MSHKSDKDAVIKRLEMSFDYVIAVLPQITPEQLTRKSAHALRQGRLLGIKQELSDMMKRCA